MQRANPGIELLGRELPFQMSKTLIPKRLRHAAIPYYLFVIWSPGYRVRRRGRKSLRFLVGVIHNFANCLFGFDIMEYELTQPRQDSNLAAFSASVNGGWVLTI